MLIERGAAIAQVLEEIAGLAKKMRDRLYNKDSRLHLDELFEKLEDKS